MPSKMLYSFGFICSFLWLVFWHDATLLISKYEYWIFPTSVSKFVLLSSSEGFIFSTCKIRGKCSQFHSILYTKTTISPQIHHDVQVTQFFFNQRRASGQEHRGNHARTYSKSWKNCPQTNCSRTKPALCWLHWIRWAWAWIVWITHPTYRPWPLVIITCVPKRRQFRRILKIKNEMN